MYGTHERRTAPIFVLLAWAALLCGPAVASSRLEPPRYDHSREIRTRPSVRKPPPTELRRETRAVERRSESDETTAEHGRAAATRPGRATQRESAATIHRVASNAAWHAARQAFDPVGLREHYRVGFYYGLRIAVSDRNVGRVAYTDGLDEGQFHSGAHAAGRASGRRAADLAARAPAERQVAEQFYDLHHEPRFEPRPGRGAYESGAPRMIAPKLELFIDAFPVDGFPWIEDRADRYLDGWEWSTARLAGCDSYTEFYDAGWSEPKSAFGTWSEVPRHETWFQRLAPDDRRYFREVFNIEFSRQLDRLYDEEGNRAYDVGFDDGFAYGAFVREEMEFRRGYQDGYAREFEMAEHDAFHVDYTAAYEYWYRSAFEDWSTHAKPHLGEIALVDGNADGVYEPGEPILATVELINYGGGDGARPVTLGGDFLTAPVRVEVEMPARSVVRTPRPIEARIDPAVPPRKRGSLRVELEDVTRTFSVRVAYPLELDRDSLRLLRQDRAGELLVEIRVENRSRLARPAVVALRGRSGDVYDSRSVGSIAPSDWERVTFAVSGLDPLDLMAGDLSFEIVAAAAGRRHDAFVHHVPDSVRDLRNRDLLMHMLDLATETEVSPAQIRRAQNLMLIRLREDWKLAAMGYGNPYKSDYKKGRSETALGDLVHSYAVRGEELANTQVFDGIGTEVARLSDRLPGMHPFLRKYMRCLARELP